MECLYCGSTEHIAAKCKSSPIINGIKAGPYLNPSGIAPKFDKGNIESRFDKLSGKLVFDVRQIVPSLTHEIKKKGLHPSRVCKRCGFQAKNGIGVDKHCENLPQCFWRILHWGVGTKAPESPYFTEKDIQYCLNFIQEIEEL